jgi:predicted DNA-binding transcriptional regulator YafY
VPCLPAIQQAVWNDRWLRMKYRSNFGAEVEQVVAPYGLVAKANLWHLVYAREGSIRVVRVSQAMAAEVLPETFIRPEDFNLAAFWEEWCAEYETDRTTYLVRVRISPALLPHLPGDFGERAELLAKASPPDAEGWVALDLPFESLGAARTRLLGLGRAVEVLEPVPLRKSIIDFAEQVVRLYQQPRD